MKNKKQNNLAKIIFIVTVIAFLCFMGFLIIIKESFDLARQKIVLAPPQSQTNTFKKNENNNIQAENFYKVNLRLNAGVSEPRPYIANDGLVNISNLGNYLIDILQLGKPTSYYSYDDFILLIAYDSTQGSPYEDENHKFNKDYFILLKTQIKALDTQKTYKTAEFSATVSKVDQKLLPFIQDSNYCETNADCSVGYNFCSYASYNKFRKLIIEVTGCEYKDYPQEDEKELEALCPIADPIYQSYEVNYAGSKCIKNKCVAQNRTVKCIE